MNLKFRYLRADEVECRIARVTKDGVQLLLYKDARCDMNLLDETVGAMNWQKDYQVIDGQLFCTIRIWDEEKQQWISKQDVGVESNTEAEKGRASDAQKRAAFAFGIGRELYTSPFIWIGSDAVKIENNRCYQRFTVSRMDVEDGVITALEIKNGKGTVVFSTEKRIKPKAVKKEEPKEEFSDLPLACEECGLIIPDATTTTGKVLPAAVIAQKSKAKFGKCLCAGCAKKVTA